MNIKFYLHLYQQNFTLILLHLVYMHILKGINHVWLNDSAILVKIK